VIEAVVAVSLAIILGINEMYLHSERIPGVALLVAGAWFVASHRSLGKRATAFQNKIPKSFGKGQNKSSQFQETMFLFCGICFILFGVGILLKR